jgi:two-component system OmpR family response regulator
MRILLAEDDAETAEFVERGLGDLGHNVVSVDNGPDALQMLSSQKLDLAVLDRMLPGLDGLSVVRRVRGADIEVPILLLTALGRIEDRVHGLEAGADDYLVKPFALSELAARIDALCRPRPRPPLVARLEHRGIVMDLLRRKVQRDGIAIQLQPREIQLLEELLRNAGRIVTRTMLLERVWTYHFDPQTNIVETHMSRLRSKLNEGGKPDAIETVRGEGYRMAGDA